jgi:Ni/Fe-hydrogenase subunit HybB-like protein
MVILVFLHGKDYAYMSSGWGSWYLVEIVGFVLIPCLMFLYGFRSRNLTLIRVAAVMSIIGIILNRLNISTFSYQWYDNAIHFPTWMELVVSMAVIFVQLLVFRWIIRRMPVYRETPDWVSGKETEQIIQH